MLLEVEETATEYTVTELGETVLSWPNQLLDQVYVLAEEADKVIAWPEQVTVGPEIETLGLNTFTIMESAFKQLTVLTAITVIYPEFWGAIVVVLAVEPLPQV